MAQGDNLKRDNLPTMQQIRYLVELEKLESKRGSVSLIAEICDVHHGSVSRYLKKCMENGILTENYKFTKEGRIWLHNYKSLIEELQGYFHNIGMAETDIELYVKKMIENLDYFVLSSMMQNEQKMQKNNSEKKRWQIPENFLKEVLEYGNHPVRFMLYRAGQQKGVSMANRGFAQPALLKHNKRGSWIQLTVREMCANSRVNDMKMKGCLETLKYEMYGVFHEAEIKGGKLRIPLEACSFNKSNGGEMTGMIPVTVTCSVGRMHMPESTAILVFWL